MAVLESRITRGAGSLYGGQGSGGRHGSSDHL